MTTPMASKCPVCGFANAAVARFCGGCGRPTSGPTALGAPASSYLQSNVTPLLAERIRRSGSAMLGERKHVTVLFADIRGSTALINHLDPEQALETLAPIMKVLMDAVHLHNGFVNQTRGDGIMALFGAPLANEDHAVQACQAALAMRAGADAQVSKAGLDIALRIGLNSGEVIIHSIGSDLAMNYDAVGRTVHLAARMEEIAAPRSVMITAATLDLAKGFVEAAPKGTVSLKGLSETVEAFELLRTPVLTRWQVRSARGLSALAGRAHELETLVAASRAASDGKGCLVTVTAEPGVGKSRLVHEFAGWLPNDWRVLQTACSPERTTSSYHPVSSLVRDAFKISADDSPAAIAEHIKARIERLDPDLVTHVPAVLSLLDLDARDAEWKKLEPPERRQKVVEAIVAIVLRLERVSPLLLLTEDVHWCDAETRLMLDTVAGVLAGKRILMLITRRPDGREVAPGQGIRIGLGALGEEDAARMADQLMGSDVSLVHVKRRILGLAQGNPFFIEELVRALTDSRTLEGEPGRYRLDKAARGFQIPQTVHSVLASRIDLLAGLPKSVLQMAAVIGTDVPVGLLAKMVEMEPDELGRQLDVLEAADLLYKLRADADPHYAFKHELTREVAYGAVMLGLRRSLHAKAMRIIETSFGNRLDEHIDKLADHAFLAELWEQALPYQVRSCRRAIKRGANDAAVSIYERSLGTLEHLPESPAKTKAQVDLRLAVIIALEPIGKHRRIAKVLREARAFAEASGDPWHKAAVNCQLTVALWRIGEHTEAMAAAVAAKSLSEEVRHQPLIFAAIHNIGLVHHETGAFAKSLEAHRDCLAMETESLDQDRVGWAALPSVVLRTLMADSLFEMGKLDEAEALAEDGARRAQAAGHAYSNIQIDQVRARILIARGRVAEAVALLTSAWKTCVELDMVQMYPIIAARLGEAHLANGDVKAALDILSIPEKLDVPLAESAFGWRYLFLAQGRAWLVGGNLAKAREAAERALALATERGERPQQAYALQLAGDIRATSNGSGRGRAAEAHWRQAQRLAEGCGMRPLAERCRVALDGKTPAGSGRSTAAAPFRWLGIPAMGRAFFKWLSL